jgi:hypothetical protein
MAEVELNLREMDAAHLLAITAGVAAALENNVHFPAPQPTPRQLKDLAELVTAADEIYRKQRAIAKEAKLKLDLAADDLRAALAAEVAHVQRESGGDIAKILSASLHVEEETSYWPFNRTGDVAEVAISMGDRPGEIDLSWDPAANASGYEVEVTHDLTGEGPWEECGATTQSKITLEKLSDRTRFWFRVRAVGEHGAGDWSEPVTKFAR